VGLAAVPGLVVALAFAALVAVSAPRVRRSNEHLRLSQWALLLVFGAVAALVVRALETFVVEVLVGRQRVDARAFFSAAVALGLVGPLAVLGQVAAAWGALSIGKREDVDPPLAATLAAVGFTLGRILLLSAQGRMHSGVRAAVLGLDEVAIAALWGYGLALSAADGRLGGTPFGRYAFVGMLFRGIAELVVRSQSAVGLSVGIGGGALLAMLAAVGIYRLARGDSDAPDSDRGLGHVGRATLTELARAELRRGRIRPLWILVGALGNVGGIALGLLGAVLVGRSAHVDFGEIDRAGPAAEYAGLILVLGVVVSFPVSAALVGLASGGRTAQGSAHVLEAGIAAMLALGALLLALGVVAPVAVAVAAACAPVVFTLAGIGAWITAGRRV